MSTYKTIDDLRSTSYVRDWWHCRPVQRLSRGRVLLTHDPSDNTLLPFAYVIYYEEQEDDNSLINLSISTTELIWRGNVLVVRLDTDNGRIPAKRALPIHMDDRDQYVALQVVLMYVLDHCSHPPLVHTLLGLFKVV